MSVTESGNATILESTFTDTHALTKAASAGGAIYTEGVVTCTDTTFANSSGNLLKSIAYIGCGSVLQ
jgi:hypothetical protein